MGFSAFSYLRVGFSLPESGVFVHPGGEGGLEAVLGCGPGVGGEADDVEVALNEVDDHALPHYLHGYKKCIKRVSKFINF